MLHLKLPPEIKKAFRILAASKGISMNALAIKMFTDFSQKPRQRSSIASFSWFINSNLNISYKNQQNTE